MKFFKFLVPNRKSIILGAIYLGFNLSVGMLFTAYIVSLVGLAEVPEVSLWEVMARFVTQLFSFLH